MTTALLPTDPTQQGTEAMSDTPILSTETVRTGEGIAGALEDCASHGMSWRRALVAAELVAATDDKGYWRHELAAFDRTFTVLTQEALRTARSSEATGTGREPAGWKLVPVEASIEMLARLCEFAWPDLSTANRLDPLRRGYAALLAVAPAPTPQDAGAVEGLIEAHLTSEAITAIMQDEWESWVSDTGCFPSDFRIERGPKLFFTPGPWSDIVAERLTTFRATQSQAPAADREGVKLHVKEPRTPSDGSILVCDEASNCVAEFYHDEYAVVPMTYNQALARARSVAALATPPPAPSQVVEGEKWADVTKLDFASAVAAEVMALGWARAANGTQAAHRYGDVQSFVLAALRTHKREVKPDLARAGVDESLRRDALEILSVVLEEREIERDEEDEFLRDLIERIRAASPPRRTGRADGDLI